MSPHDLSRPPVLLEEAAGAEDFAHRLRWKWNRLRCMSPAEVAHRIGRSLVAGAERAHLGWRGPIPAPDLLASPPRPWLEAHALVDPVPYLKEADRIAAGRLTILALPDAFVGSPPRWNRDPKTGIEAPLRYGKTLDYRNPRRVGDIKYLWELNRHAHLVRLAQAWSLSGRRSYFEVIDRHLTSWFDACPYPMGANWASALEAALRLINWAATWQLLGGAESALFRDADGARLRRRWLDSVYQHAQFIHDWFSLYSSANNHLLGEAAGLFIASQTWPFWARASAWRERAKSILEREVPRQNGADGVNLEQATSYQQFVLDLLILALLAGKANGQWFGVGYEARVEAMLEFLASVMDAGGNVPSIGDADDARALDLGADGRSAYRSLLATGAILFRRGEFAFKAGSRDDRTRWLLGAQADEPLDREECARAMLPVRRSFPEGGYYVLGSDFESAEEIRVVADAGPLGYRSIAAHGHADALSFTLSVGGLEYLVDPGTYAYHTQAAWRSYFRGTAAHNTVRVDGRDQSEQGGNFLWLRKARAGCSHWCSNDESDTFEGWQDGYMDLEDPVMHRRRIVLDKRTRRLVVEDRLEMRGEHDIELIFHCTEHCSVEAAGGDHVLRQPGGSVALRLPALEGAEVTVHRGSLSPIAGWISRRLDSKTPAPTIIWRARLRCTTQLRTEIAC